MLFKELKKIAGNRWIAFLLIVLCAFNIFFCINSANQETIGIIDENEQQQQQQEKIENYSEYISGMRDNLSTISSFKMFNKKSDYHKKSAKKVIDAYDKVKDVKPVYGNYKAIDIVTKLGFSDIAIFVVVLQCAVVLIFTDRKNGMMRLIKSCRRGRVSLICAKIKALFIADFFVVLFIFIPLMIVTINVLDCDSLNVPIQSVPEFYECSLNVSIFEYLIIFMILKYIAVAAYSVMLLAGVVLFKNVGLLYTMLGVVIAISICAKQMILWDYKIALLKIVSPITLIDTSSLTYKYYNMNIVEMPFNITSVSLFAILMYFIVFIAISIILFSNNIEIEIIHKKFKINRKRKFHVRTITMIEYKKLLIVNKGMIILVVLAIMQGYFIRNVDTEMSETQKYYAEYMEELEGIRTKDTEEYIAEEQKRFNTIQGEYDKNVERYTNGEIQYEAFLVISSQYSWDMMPKEAFDMVKSNNRYLKKLEKEQNVKGWLFDDIGTKYIIHPKEIYNETIAWIFMMTAILLLVITCFSYEYETGMNRLTETMLYGTKRLKKKKWNVSFIMTTLIFLISNVPFIVLLLQNYKFSGVFAPVKSMQEFKKFPLNVNLLTVLILLYIVKYMVTLVAMLIAMGISKTCRGQIKQLAISFLIIVMPLIIMALYNG